MKRDFESQVFDTIKKYKMLTVGENVVVGLSGGADSTALCLVLCALKRRLKINVSAVHLNHNLRGDEAMRDERFVRDFCKKHDILLKVYSENIKEGASSAKMGVEEYARKRRYEIFQKEAEKTNAKIATAHNFNDCAETLIFNITRGCSVTGLGSIPPVRDNIIRPLIETSREKIECYLADENAEFVTDSTNLSDEYTRNKIRHNVLPVLCEINPAFLQATARLCSNARQLSEFTEERINDLLLIESAADLAKCSDFEISEYVVKRCRQKLNVTPENSQVKTAAEIIKKGSGSVDFCGGRMRINAGKIEFLCVDETDEKDESFCVDFDENGVKTPYFRYEFKIISKKEYDKERKINSLLLKNVLDYDKISNSLFFRSRLEKDEVLIVKRKCTKSLKKLFSEAKISLELRNRLGILSNDKNDILWVQQFGAAEKFAVDEKTERVLLIITKEE